MKKLFSLLVVLTLPVLCFAQSDFRSGYIITLQGDTLKGEVNHKGDLKNALECTFRVNESAQNQNFKPGQLKGYGFTGGKFYEAKTATIVNRVLLVGNKFKEEPVTGHDSVSFMQVLVKGKATLYYLRDATSANHYYFQMNDKPVQELVYLQASMVDPKGNRYWYKSKQFVGILKIAFKDCPAITEKIERTDFKSSSLQSLFKAYNYCVEPTQKIVTQIKPKPVYTFGAMAGLSFSALNIEMIDHYLGAGNYESAPAFTAGISLDITMPVTNEKLSFHNALFLTTRNYTANYNYQNTDLYNSDYQVFLKFQYVRLETAIRYTAPTKGIKPFAQAGICNNYMLSSEETIFSTKHYLNYPGEDKREPDYLSPIIRKHQIGIIGGAGLKYALPNRHSVSLQVNYEYNTGFTKAMGITTKSQNTAILLGYSF
jgi:hypothetical protein